MADTAKALLIEGRGLAGRSLALAAVSEERVERIGSDAVASHRRFHLGGACHVEIVERRERCDHDVGGVDLEVGSKALAGIGESKPVGAKCDKRTPYPRGDLMRYRGK